MERNRSSLPFTSSPSSLPALDSLGGSSTASRDNSAFEPHLVPSFNQRRMHSDSDPTLAPAPRRPELSSRYSDPFAPDQTWMDFLRNGGDDDGSGRYTSTSSSGNSWGHNQRREGGSLRPAQGQGLQEAIRKRRLTAPESPGRKGGYGPNHALGTSEASLYTQFGASRGSRDGQPGRSEDDAIDLTSPEIPPVPRPLSPPRPSMRRESDIVLPPWQPDSDVSKCPVCGTQFGFFYRKHHCRKCGRVVCANCSPHRITIPRQFIVHPPPPVSGSHIIDLTSDDDGGSPADDDLYRNPALGGGEEVRVCNPCVPDPNLSPPPQPQSEQTTPQRYQFPILQYQETHARPSPFQATNMNRNLPFTNTRSFSRQMMPPRLPGHRSTLSDLGHLFFDQGQNTSGNRRISLQNRLYEEPSHRPYPALAGSVPSRSGFTNSPLASSPHHPSHYRSNSQYQHHARSVSTATPRHPSMLDINGPLPPSPPPLRHLRRQIPEEDECPVCGNELPPRGPDGSTVERENHVQECIQAHSFASSSTTPAAPSPSSAVDGAISAGTATPRQSQGGSARGTPVQAEGSRPRRGTSRGMVVFAATEKDCVDEGGGPQECVICFEEFEAGDEMGRLECLCKFHRKCIRQWWDTKGAGSCPTHQLHD